MKNIFASKTGKILSYIIFWAWNLIFLIFLFAVILPYLGAGIFEAFFAGEISFDFFIILLAGTSIPVISVILGLTKFRKNPKKLFQLFYGIEIPLGFILFLRLWLLKELTPGTWQLLILLVFGGIIFLYDMISNKKIENKILDTVRFCGHTVLMLIAVYFGIIMLFYFIPLLSQLIIGFFSFGWIENIGFMIKGAFIAFFFILISGTILLILPVAMPTLYIKKFIKGVKEFNLKYSTNFTFITAGSIIIINILLFVNLNIQPQKEVFEMLDKENLSQNEKMKLLKQQDKIKKGLLNSYLASYRYIAAEDDNGIKYIYEDALNMNDKNADIIQDMYNAVVKPFIYDGTNHWIEKQKADSLYSSFFDAPIQKSESKTIKNALQATWDRDGIEAGLLNINDEKVLILEQNINIKEENGTAEIEICETYQNKTTEQQEIFYYFSLPENAVITGLWLSDDETDKKYSYSVSPRGAAQQVYKNEVQRRIDPSLLEQTGPGQYRLRAFPVPAITSWERNSPGFEAGEFDDKLKLWLRYVCISKESNYPLPRLSEKRNVYWTGDTKITVNGKKSKKLNSWLPEELPSSTQFSYNSVFINNNISITPSPMKNINSAKLKGKLAVLTDPSYSMNHVKSQINEVIDELKMSDADIDILFYEDSKIQKKEIKNFNTDELLLYGSSTFYDLLSDLNLQLKTTLYDDIIIITDAGSYELNKNKAKADNLFFFEDDTSGEELNTEQKTSFDFDIPVNFLHLNYKFPQSYDDSVLETIEKSGGSIAGNIIELMKKITANKIYNDPTSIADTYSGITWKYNLIDVDFVQNKNALIKHIAVKQYIKMQIKQNDSVSLNLLDQIHEIAKSNSIVTPYSSMIVLVDDRQKEALEKAEQAEDRFERETETGIEDMSDSSLMNVTGIPEPEEWILIIITALMLIFFYSKYLKK